VEAPVEALPEAFPVAAGAALLLLPVALAEVLSVLVLAELLGLMPEVLALALSTKSPFSLTLWPICCGSWLAISEEAITSTDRLPFPARVNVSAPFAPLDKQPVMVLFPTLLLALVVVVDCVVVVVCELDGLVAF